MTKAERTRTIKYALAESSTAAQTKEHEEDKHNGMQEKTRKERK